MEEIKEEKISEEDLIKANMILKEDKYQFPENMYSKLNRKIRNRVS